MLIKTGGIVIKNTKYSETSVISKIYTRQLGMQSYMINGVRSARAAIRPSMLQPLVLLDMVVYHNPVKDIQRIKEVKGYPVLNSLHFDIVKSTIGLFASELIYRAIQEEEPNQPMYDFIERFILALDTAEGDISLFPLYFALYLSQFLGFFPHDNWSEQRTYFNLSEGNFVAQPDRESNSVEPPHSHYLAMLMRTPMQEIEGLKIPKASRTALLQKMMDYYHLHLPSFQSLKSVPILANLLKED